MTESHGGKKNVRALFDEAEEVAGGPGPEDRAPSGRRAKGPPWTLPDDAPVTPLGIAGDVHYYLDAAQQLRDLKAKDHSRLNVMALFGERHAFLYDVWPRLSKNKATNELEVTGWMPEAAAEALMKACARKGVWDVFGRLRGPGAWVGDDGGLVFHCGDTVWHGPGDMRKPGMEGRFVYPAAAAIPRPHDEAQPDGEAGPGAELLQVLRSWAWKRGETDALLLLGWIGAALYGGALSWRPMCWITGDRATGKSTLHDLIRLVMGEAILSSSDASAAGIWQTLGHKSLPVALDEIEAREDNRQAQAVIKLAREAASGGVVLRGSAEHVGTQFTSRSCFLFSSILIPPLLGQDVSRMAVLELEPLRAAAGGGVPTVPALARDRARCLDLGRKIRRRLADQWPRFPETLETWRQQLAAAGHNGRSADQFGTLLACADLILSDSPPESEVLAGWCERLSPAALSAQTDDAPDHERCVAHLLTTPADVWRQGGKSPIARYLRRVALLHGADQLDMQEAQDVLAGIGLRVEDLQPLDEAGPPAGRYLCIANSHQGLAKVFEGTHWIGRSGSSPGWRQSFLRVAGAEPLGAFRDHNGKARQTLRFGAVACRAVCVPVGSIFPNEE